jgi:hypothetical protein
LIWLPGKSFSSDGKTIESPETEPPWMTALQVRRGFIALKPAERKLKQWRFSEWARTLAAQGYDHVRGILEGGRFAQDAHRRGRFQGNPPRMGVSHVGAKGDACAIPGLNVGKPDADLGGNNVVEFNRHNRRNVIVRIRVVGIAGTVSRPGQKKHQTEDYPANKTVYRQKHASAWAFSPP